MNRVNKKILPLCIKPSIMAYSHHAYIHCILENTENIGSEIIRINIPNADNYKWIKISKQVNIEWEKKIYYHL